jgi:hypothetical protein
MARTSRASSRDCTGVEVLALPLSQSRMRGTPWAVRPACRPHIQMRKSARLAAVSPAASTYLSQITPEAWSVPT